MGLFPLGFLKKEPLAENYLSLTITVDQVVACIWQFNQNQVEVIGFGQKIFPNLEALVHESAIAIDTAAKLSKSDVSKVVFGLSDYYLVDGKPQPEILKVLKNLAQDLELDPQAYVSLGSSVNHLLKIEEGITPQAILIGIFGDFCEVHLLKSGKVEKSQSRKGEIGTQRIGELLESLKENDQSLPARIIIFGKIGNVLQEDLKKSGFGELFIHEPKIEVFDDQELGKSVAYAHAADILGTEPTLTTVEKTQEESKVNDMGFIEGEDILRQAPVPQTAGNLSEQPIAQEPTQLAVEIPDNKLQNQPQETKSENKLKVLLSLARNKISLKKAAIIFAVFLFAAFILSFIAGLTLSKAQVQIRVRPDPIEKNFDAKVVVGGTFDSANAQIPGSLATGTAAASQKAVATGAKKLGNKAKGAISVRNWDKQAKTFGKNSEIITADGLKFTLDDDITVASRSAGPGTTKANATASDVGPKYNLSSGTEFEIVGFDSLFYDAVAEGSFTGGDEKQVTVVAKDDLARLEKSLTDSLVDKAKADLRTKNPNVAFADSTITIKITKKDFDKKTDEEAALVNLNMELEAQLIGYSNDDLKNLFSDLVNRDAPGNLQVRAQDIEILDLKSQRPTSQTPRQKETLNLSGRLRANLIPKFDEADLKGKIAAKSVKEARSIIKTLPAVSDVQIKFEPNLPFVDSLPRNRDKISFSIEST